MVDHDLDHSVNGHSSQVCFNDDVSLPIHPNYASTCSESNFQSEELVLMVYSVFVSSFKIVKWCFCQSLTNLYVE